MIGPRTEEDGEGLDVQGGEGGYGGGGGGITGSMGLTGAIWNGLYIYTYIYFFCSVSFVTFWFCFFVAILLCGVINGEKQMKDFPEVSLKKDTLRPCFLSFLLRDGRCMSLCLRVWETECLRTFINV